VKRRRAPLAVKLRRGRIGDLDALVVLERAVFTDHILSPRSFRRFLTSPKSTLLVAEVAGTVAGYVLVLYRRGSKLARLYGFASAAQFRGRGIGRRLLRAAEKDAKDHRCRAIRLEVQKASKAITLYENSGYRCFGERPRYYHGRFDALLFEKPLGARKNPA
jgi:[ribosomal protein S18]-alanine N-acetyltransferase